MTISQVQIKLILKQLIQQSILLLDNIQQTLAILNQISMLSKKESQLLKRTTLHHLIKTDFQEELILLLLIILQGMLPLTQELKRLLMIISKAKTKKILMQALRISLMII
jgi:DNA replication protein DnaD